MTRARSNERAYLADELVAAVLVVSEHVVARARGREEHCVARHRERSTQANRIVKRGDLVHGKRIAHGPGNLRARFADEHERTALGSQGLHERVIAPALVSASGDEHGARLGEDHAAP